MNLLDRKKIDPNMLMTVTRFDIVFKLIFLDTKSYSQNYAKNIYLDHIKAFTLGSFNEPGDSKRINAKSYIDNFIEIKNSISKLGFTTDKSVIPIGIKGTIENGSHRVAAAINLGEPVIVESTGNSDVCYDYKFFKNRGMLQEYLDEGVIEFVNRKENCYIALFWPISKNNNLKYSRYFDRILASKTLEVDYSALKNIIKFTYREQEWIGSQNDNYRGAEHKTLKCYSKNNELDIIVFQEENLAKVKNIKRDIRKYLNNNQHAVHITDNHYETKDLARLLFNQNGVNFIKSSLESDYRIIKNKIMVVKEFLKKNDINNEDFLIDSGFVLELMGYRKSKDIDYLSPILNISDEKIKINSHLQELQYYDIPLSELIYSPSNYFIYDDIKFMSVDNVKDMKNKRSEIKDIEDLRLINKYYKGGKLKINSKKLSTRYLWIKIKLEIEKYVISILKILNLLNLVAKVIRVVRRENKNGFNKR